MIVRINGKEESLASGTTIARLVAEKKLMPERIVIEHNLRIIPRAQWATCTVAENDILEIISFVGGG